MTRHELVVTIPLTKFKDVKEADMFIAKLFERKIEDTGFCISSGTRDYMFGFSSKREAKFTLKQWKFALSQNLIDFKVVYAFSKE